MPDIVLKNKNGEDVTYQGIETVTFDTPTEGEQVTYSYGTVEEKTLALDMASGNQEIVADEGKLLSKVTVEKPSDLIAINIKKNVNIGGVVGEFIGNEEEVTVDLNLASGSQEVVPSEDKLLSKVVINKPETLLPENIAKDVEIAGVVGTHEGVNNLTELIENGFKGELVSDATNVSPYFFYNQGVTDISLPNCIDINNNAFYNCKSLINIDAPLLQSIGFQSFYQVSLTKIDFPLVKTIGMYAFQSCDEITEIRLPSLKTAGAYCFQRCDGLTMIDENSFPLLETIEERLFEYCYALNKVELSSNVKTINEYAFNSCTGLNSISMPEVETISDGVFYNCNNFQYRLTLKKIITIGSNAFYSCTSLRSIDLGENISSIGNTAFYSCSNLAAVILRSATPPRFNTTSTGSKPFYNLSNVYFYVPSDLVSTYQSDSYWSTYSSKIRALEDYFYQNKDYSNTNVKDTFFRSSTNTSYSETIELDEGDTVIVTIAHRDSLTIPDDCTLLYTSTDSPSTSAVTYLSFVMYKAESDISKTFEFTVASSTFNCFNYVVLTNVKNVTYSGTYHTYIVSPTSYTSVPDKPEGQALLWGCIGVSWTYVGGNWLTVPNDIIYLSSLDDLNQPRSANFIDFGSGEVNRTFKGDATNTSKTAYKIIDALELEFYD